MNITELTAFPCHAVVQYIRASLQLDGDADNNNTTGGGGTTESRRVKRALAARMSPVISRQRRLSKPAKLWVAPIYRQQWGKATKLPWAAFALQPFNVCFTRCNLDTARSA